MAEIGYTLSCEEHPPADLVRCAALAEGAGFDFVVASDHFHPWTDQQGQSPFVWGVLGGVAHATQRVGVGTGVTCPTIRVHPAIVAQAAATAAAMMPGRFFLGVGSGENLNEHVLGDRWPVASVRLEMLDEAIDVIRMLWGGRYVTHHGPHYTVENARLYTLPDEPPPIVVAAGGPKAVDLAARKGDGMMGVSPERDMVEAFAGAGGKGKPCYGQLHVCWDDDEARARKTARRWWPNAALKGELGQELPLPRHFEQAAANVSEDDVAEAVVCGPDPDRHAAAIGHFVDAGFTHVWVHQVGPDQQGFIAFYSKEVLPRLR